MQGLARPSIRVRLWREHRLWNAAKWLGFVAVAVPLAFSALYEIIEWLASLSNPTDTEAFLGTQGYIWDTQTDMFWCLMGAIIAIVLLTKVHDKYLRKLIPSDF